MTALRRLRAVLGFFVVVLATTAWARPADAAELLMFELRGCPWCRLWHAEVGPAYPNTPAGQRAPLRIIDIKRPDLRGMALAKPVLTSPTFVLVEDGMEIGRITGYPGADFFWPLLDELLAKLDAGAQPQPHSHSGAASQRAL